MKIRYHLGFEDGSTEMFEVDLDREWHSNEDHGFLPEWTRLEVHQCPGCPLNKSEHTYCPTAVDVSKIVVRFSDVISHRRTIVKVETPNRTYFKEADVQTGLRSLIGLVMATSGCPILSRLKSQAYYHLPFATIEESIMRTVSAYLLKQYFLAQDGHQPDWDLRELNGFYQMLQEVNLSLKKRIDAASLEDANMNAVSSLGMLSIAVSFSLEDQLEEIKDVFLRENPTESLP